MCLQKRENSGLNICWQGQQLRLGWLQCEFRGLLVSLKLSQNQIQKQNNGTEWNLRWGQGEEGAAVFGRWRLPRPLCLSTVQPTACRPAWNSCSLSTHFLPAETNLPPEPRCSGVGVTFTHGAPARLRSVVYKAFSLLLPTSLQ